MYPRNYEMAVPELRKTALDVLSALVYKTCLQVEREMTEYLDLHRKDVNPDFNFYVRMRPMNTFICSMPHVLERELFESTFTRVRQGMLRNLSIFYAAFVNEYTKRFTVWQASAGSSLTADFNMFIANLTSVVELDISIVAANYDLLETIGGNCHRLEVIIMTSNYICLDKDHRQVKHVSAEGMLCLAQCKELRVIEDKGNRGKTQFQNIGCESIIELLANLPKLEILTYKYMDRALTQTGTSLHDLKLTFIELSRLNLNVHHMIQIAHLCPNLREISCNIFLAHTMSMVMNALLESKMKIASYKFISFPLMSCSELQNLFVHSGQYITKLVIRYALHVMDLTMAELEFIGHTCKNLEHLDMCTFMEPDSKLVHMNNLPKISLPPIDSNHLPFKELTFLNLNGAFDALVPIFCLKNAHKIQIIKLKYDTRYSDEHSPEKMFKQLIKVNQLMDLQDLTVHPMNWHSKLPPELRSHLYKCKKLTNTVWD